MDYLSNQVLSLSVLEKCVAAVVGILAIHAAFRVLKKTLPQRFGRTDARYRVRKFLGFAGYVAILLFVAIPFEDRLGRLSFTLGVVGAGVAVALQDLLASMAGAFAISFSRLFAVGDRIQVGETRGDVIDIGLLRTTLMETGNWVSRDMYNGRIVHIPNSTVLKGTIFNYSQGFRFIWDEIKVVFTSTSDCQLAREMLLRVAREAIGEYVAEAQLSWKTITDNYRSANPSLEPTVSLVVNAGSLEFTVDYVVDYTQRTVMRDRLFTKIAQEVTNSNGRLEWASSGVTIVNQPPTADAIETLLSARPRRGRRGEFSMMSYGFLLSLVRCGSIWHRTARPSGMAGRRRRHSSPKFEVFAYLRIGNSYGSRRPHRWTEPLAYVPRIL